MFTGIVEADDPELTVQNEYDGALAHQPLRAVMGLHKLDPTARMFNDSAETMLLATRDPHEALAQLHSRDRQHVFLEGGPHLAAAFLRAGLVDEVVAYGELRVVDLDGAGADEHGVAPCAQSVAVHPCCPRGHP